MSGLLNKCFISSKFSKTLSILLFMQVVLTIITNYHTWNKLPNSDWGVSHEGRVARPILDGLTRDIAWGTGFNHTTFLFTECRWRHCLVMVCTLPSRKTWLSSRLLDPSRDHVTYSNRTLEDSLIKNLFTEMCAGLWEPKRMWKHPGSNRKSSLGLGSKKQS